MKIKLQKVLILTLVFVAFLSVTGQNSGELYLKKAPTGQLLSFRKTHTEFTKRIIS